MALTWRAGTEISPEDLAASTSEEVDAHINRVATVNAISSALASANAGRYADAMSTLEATHTVLASCRSHTTPVTTALREDLAACRSRLSSDDAVRGGGMAYALQVPQLYS